MDNNKSFENFPLKGSLIVDHSYLHMIDKFLSYTQKSLYISTFKAELLQSQKSCFLRTFWKKIIDLADKSINVRLLLNFHEDRRSIAKTNIRLVHFLKHSKIDIRHLLNNRCCHAKVMIFDNELAVIGSHNLSAKSLRNNFEISYILNDSKQVKFLSNIFLKTFYNGKKF
jgi:phosphatidylserine/phosphatidylglycerophosphate/cardiolipin synthase-like enzyme